MNRSMIALALGLALSGGAALAQSARQPPQLRYFNDRLGPNISDFRAQLTNDPSFNPTYGSSNGRQAVVQAVPNTSAVVSNPPAGASTAFLATNLIGRPVTDVNGQNVGEVQDLLISSANKVDGVVLGVGNALGMGQKRVAVGIDRLQPPANGNGPLISSISRDQLSAAPDFSQQPMILR